MRVLIISDTHRRDDRFLELIKRVKPIDMLIHCGDSEGSEDLYLEYAGCPVEIVSGNNDFFTDLPREKEFQLGKYKVWLTHGHNYYVSMGNETIKKEAGHTHKPVIDMEKDITAINPGSLSFPRQEGRRPSYILMELDKDGQAHYHLNYL